MKLKTFLFSGLVVVALLFASGCYYDNFSELHPSLGENCDTTHVMSYANDIVPILNNSCGTNNSCHGPSSTASIDLSTYAGVYAKVSDTFLYSSLIWDGNASNMPKNSTTQLSSCSIVKIKKWIDNGAPNN